MYLRNDVEASLNVRANNQIFLNIPGRIVVSYDDKGITREIESQGTLSDGAWHTVSVLKDRKSIMLQVGL